MRIDAASSHLLQRAKIGTSGGNGGSERRMASMTTFTIQHEREEDGRWLAEVPELPGVLAYGDSADEAMAKAQALALRVLAERLEHKEAKPQSISIGIAAA